MPVFEASGFHVIDLGEDLNDEAFVEGIRKHKPQIVGFGTYMTSTFMHTKQAVEAITKAGLRDRSRSSAAAPPWTPRPPAAWALTTPATTPGRASRK